MVLHSSSKNFAWYSLVKTKRDIFRRNLYWLHYGTYNSKWKKKYLNLVALGFVGNETDALDLALIIEPDDPNEGARVSLLGLLYFVHDLDRVSAPVHRQLPHCPVTTILVPRRPVVLTVYKCMLQIRIQRYVLVNVHFDCIG